MVGARRIGADLKEISIEKYERLITKGAIKQISPPVWTWTPCDREKEPRPHVPSIGRDYPDANAYMIGRNTVIPFTGTVFPAVFYHIDGQNSLQNIIMDELSQLSERGTIKQVSPPILVVRQRKDIVNGRFNERKLPTEFNIEERAKQLLANAYLTGPNKQIQNINVGHFFSSVVFYQLPNYLSG